MGRSDEFVMIGIIALIVVWIYFAFRKWLLEPTSLRYIPLNNDIKESVAVQLLERAGYEVIGGKFRIPFHFTVNGDDLHSRLFVDLVARQGKECYLVKIARDRMPIDWTGSGVRNRLLAYFLIYGDCAGILYIDEKEQQIHKIQFQFDEDD